MRLQSIQSSRERSHLNLSKYLQCNTWEPNAHKKNKQSHSGTCGWRTKKCPHTQCSQDVCQSTDWLRSMPISGILLSMPPTDAVAHIPMCATASVSVFKHSERLKETRSKSMFLPLRCFLHLFFLIKIANDYSSRRAPSCNTRAL